jgi:hypothetical protein
MSTLSREKTRSLLPARLASIAVMLIGAVSLAGWIFDIEAFKEFYAHGVTIKANTAIALMLAGFSLYLFLTDQATSRKRLTGQICAVLVLAVGVLSLSEHLFEWNLGIDQILFQERPGLPGSTSPGRMGPPASLCLMVGGLALLLLHAQATKYRFHVQVLALAILLFSAPALIGYAYNVEVLFGLAKYTAISFHTALAMAILAFGILLARPDQGIVSLIFDKGSGGSTARRLLPVAILMPLIFGWFRLRGEEMGLFQASFGTAVMMLIMMTIFSTLILLNAAVSRKMDIQREKAEENLVRLASFPKLNPHPIMEADFEGRIHYLNPAAESLFPDLQQNGSACLTI